jgi:branched-chain amino acid transport system ATP-binding protein
VSTGANVILEVRGLSCRFGGLFAVKNVSFQLRQGEILGLIGPNGAGKTTLISMISGTVPTSEGEALLKGRRITGMRPHQITQMGLARTFQVVKPFRGMTVRENVAVGALFGGRNDLAPAQRVADECLELVGLSETANRPSASLSIGELKRLELARALAMRPEVLLLDEVMAGLNPANVEKMMELVVRINNEQRLSVLIIDHVLKAVMGISQRIMVLQQGEKIAEGTPQEVSNNPAVMSGYLGERFAKKLLEQESAR